MPFIPHTEADIREMLAVIGADSIEALFDEIPSGLQGGELTGIPSGTSEMAMARRMRDRARQDGEALCFIGAGAYDHYIPAAVWQIASRGEFLTAYTPYQPEASQGTLQLLYEFQSMLVALTGLDAANASLYDGASALAEAVLMAVRLCRSGARRVLMPRSLHPHYRQVVRTLVSGQGIELIELPIDPAGGHTDPASLEDFNGQGIAALVIPQPNFFGVLEEVDALTAWARRQGVITIA
ncbi:MAG: glycine dehydrogenase, partial [Pseudomonadota bacterium]